MKPLLFLLASLAAFSQAKDAAPRAPAVFPLGSQPSATTWVGRTIIITGTTAGSCTSAGSAPTNCYAAGGIWVPLGGAAGGVTSVTAGASGGVICTPTTGAVVCDIDPAYVPGKTLANTFTAAQTFSSNSNYTPLAAQTISAASDTILCNATVVQIAPSSTQYVLTSTPSIAAGTAGQKCVIYNTGTAPVVLQDTSLVASTTIEAADNINVIIPGGGQAEFYFTGSAWRELVSYPFNLQQLRYRDDFCGETGVGYDLGWNKVSNGSETPTPTATRPCIGFIRVLNDGTSIASMTLNSIDASMFFVWRSNITPERVGANDNWKFGISSDISTLTPAEGAYFEKSGANWIGTCRTGSASTSTAAITAQSTGTKVFQIRRVSATAIEFNIDGTALSVTSGCPGSQVVKPFYQGLASDSSFQSLRMDWFIFKAPVNR